MLFDLPDAQGSMRLKGIREESTCVTEKEPDCRFQVLIRGSMVHREGVLITRKE